MSGMEKVPNDSALFAAIDVGSNAMRLGLAAYDSDGTPQLIQRYREPVRLGKDVFATGYLTPEVMDDAVEAFKSFRAVMEQHDVTHCRATATSAMRDAKNGHELRARILAETGIDLQLISGEEEARLVHYSISRRVDLSNKYSVLIDMGGGSVEVTLCQSGEVVSSQSLNIGTVRLLNMLGEEGDFHTLLSEYLDSTRKKIREQIGKRNVKICVATGGNAAAIGELKGRLLGVEGVDSIHLKELALLIEKISVMTFEERVRDLGLRPDRADVILPAAMVFYEIMKVSGAKVMRMPDAGLLDGIVLDMLDSENRTNAMQRRNLLALARTLGKRYGVNARYSKVVARLSLSLFDQLATLHSMGWRERLLLEMASLVHEIGMYVHVGGHQRHAAYIITVSPLLGLSDMEKSMLAQVVRFQRKNSPDDGHADFLALNEKSQKKVWMLSALLRLGIALNKERRQRLDYLVADCSDKKVVLHLEGSGDLLLERWAALKVSDYFHHAFGVHIDVDLKRRLTFKV